MLPNEQPLVLPDFDYCTKLVRGSFRHVELPEEEEDRSIEALLASLM
jgi:hypothetical protein